MYAGHPAARIRNRLDQLDCYGISSGLLKQGFLKKWNAEQVISPQISTLGREKIGEAIAINHFPVFWQNRAIEEREEAGSSAEEETPQQGSRQIFGSKRHFVSERSELRQLGWHATCRCTS